MQIVVQDCLEMLRSQAEPEVFISRQKCSLCQWYSHCYAIAKSQQHLSLLPGVTPSRYQYLQALDINTVESLANIDPIQLEPALDTEVAQKLVWQAQVTHQNQAIAIPDDWAESAPLNKNALRTAALTKLKTQNSSHALCPIELYFDIEAEPEQNFNYLLGVLVVNHSDKTETFYPLLAERPTESTALIWQQFLDLVQAYPESSIFHFCDYEIQTVKQLAKQHKTPYYVVEKILSRFVDVYEQVTKTVVLPIESYSLKSIANWIGFEWRDSQANGSQSICWYDQWLKTSDRTFLESIVRYNEDDCRATYQVKNWLVENLPELGIARKKPESLSIAISNY
jgi:uncharacterized protein